MKRRVLLACSLVLVILAVGAILFALTHSKSHTYTIPKSIKSQLGFPVLFLQEPAGQYTLDTTSLKYGFVSSDTKIFSFIINSPASSITFAEQPYPEALIYDKLTNSVNPYSEVGTAYGTVTLGRPKDAGGQQTAVLQYGTGTLIFAKPSHDLSDSQWQFLFNALNPIK